MSVTSCARWLVPLALVACATGHASTTEEPEPSAGGATSSGGAPQGGAPAGGQSSGGAPAGGQSSGGAPAGGQSSGGAATGGAPAAGQGGGGSTSASGQSSGGAATGGAPAAGHGGGAGAAGGPTSCSGKVVGGFCWYYAASAAQSCGAVCQAHGGYHVATRDFAGSGGTDLDCLDVLDAVGAPGSGVSALVGSGAAVGCFYSPVLSQRHRVADTATSQNATYDVIGARRVCACNE